MSVSDDYTFADDLEDIEITLHGIEPCRSYNSAPLNHNISLIDYETSDESVSSFTSNSSSDDSIPPVAYHRDIMLTTTQKNTEVYKQPSNKSHDALIIWNSAGLLDFETLHSIEIKLLDWALCCADLVILDRKIQTITWNAKNNVTCSSTWPTFLKWFACACQVHLYSH